MNRRNRILIFMRQFYFWRLDWSRTINDGAYVGIGGGFSHEQVKRVL
jgi:hypothetical protein